ncbi:MAG: hypothetical protein ACR2ND_04715 [Solirubrobacteraceae bacterium]
MSAVWGVIDQAVSSASNLLLVATIARVSDVAGFGEFSLVYLFYGVAIGVMRSGGGDILLLQTPGMPSELRSSSRAVLGLALGLGVIAATITLIATALSGESLDSVGAALGLVLAVVLVQDAFRYCLFAAGLPAQAALSDFVWLSVQVALTAGLLLVLGHLTAPEVVLAWAAGALASVAVALWQTRILPAFRGVGAWIGRERARAASFVADFLLMSGANYFAVYLVALFASVSAVAAVRGSAFVFAPLDALSLGVRIFVLPAFARAMLLDSAVLRRRAGLVAAASGAGTALWTVLALLLPHRAGTALLGPTWDVTRPLIFAMAIASGARYVALPFQTALRALGDVRRIVILRVLVTTLVLTATVIGTLASGARGAVTALAIAYSADAVLSWGAFSLSSRSHALRNSTPQ